MEWGNWEVSILELKLKVTDTRLHFGVDLHAFHCLLASEWKRTKNDNKVIPSYSISDCYVGGVFHAYQVMTEDGYMLEIVTDMVHSAGICLSHSENKFT